jgi:hypothetical protein
MRMAAGPRCRAGTAVYRRSMCGRTCPNVGAQQPQAALVRLERAIRLRRLTTRSDVHAQFS